MRRLAAILIILWVGVAGAAVVIRQNDVTEIVGGPTTNTVQMRRGETLKYRITAVQGTNTVPYTGATAVTGLLYDVRLGDVVARGTGTVDSAASGIFTVHVTPPALEIGAYYELRALVYGATGVVGTVAWDPAYVDSAECSTCKTVVVVSGGGTAGPVSNVTIGAANSWTAATGALVLSSNNPPVGYGTTNEPAGTLWYTADGWLLGGTNDTAGAGASVSVSNLFYRPPLQTNGYDIDFDTTLITTNDQTATGAWFVALGRGASWWQTNGALVMTVAPPSTGYHASALSLPLPAPPWRFEAHVVNVAWSNLQSCGLTLWSTNGGKALQLTTDRQAGAASYERVALAYWSSPWTVGNSAVVSLYYIRHPPVYWAIENDGTNLFTQFSPDGQVWATFGNSPTSNPWGTSMSGVPSPYRIGYGWDWSANAGTNLNESVQRWTGLSRWFRRMK